MGGSTSSAAKQSAQHKRVSSKQYSAFTGRFEQELSPTTGKANLLFVPNLTKR
jgi:hypothetical protein